MEFHDSNIKNPAVLWDLVWKGGWIYDKLGGTPFEKDHERKYLDIGQNLSLFKA